MDKEMLNNVINALMQVETKGQSVLILSDCIRVLQGMVSAPAEEKNETD